MRTEGPEMRLVCTHCKYYCYNSYEHLYWCKHKEFPKLKELIDFPITPKWCPYYKTSGGI